MGRLVDADALLYQLDKRRTYEVMDGRNKAYGKGVRDAMKDIDAAPTIDAIPVEWFKDRRDIYLKAYHAGHESELHTAAILNDTLKAWYKEQEAMKNGH